MINNNINNSLNINNIFGGGGRAEVPLQLTQDQLTQLRERHRLEFLAQGRALMQICQTQQADQARLNHGVSLNIITQMESPMVVRGYKTREPHFEPSFSLQVRPTNAHVIGPVEAYFLNENLEAVVPHAFDQRDVDANNMALFGGLRIPSNTSTRMSRSFILFACYVLYQNQLLWTGAFSHPLICITNSSQLCSAKARLIWYQFNLPDEQGSIEWNQLHSILVNYFQRIATPPGKNARPFSAEDNTFLFSRISCQATITWPIFRDFWHWFCTTAETCRERLGERWTQTVSATNNCWLIHGFLTRQDANNVLASQPTGTFIIRFSESKPNNLVASFSTSSGHIEHKLIDPRAFEGGRNLDDVINKDLRFITALYTPSGPIPKNVAFPLQTNIINRYDNSGYIN